MEIKTALSEIVLPAGSTSDELQEVINTAAGGETIIISSDMPFTDTVTISDGKNFTIQSDADNNWVLYQKNLNMRHFKNGSQLTLQNITLDGGWDSSSGVSSGGGGIHSDQGSMLTLNGGTLIQNCYTNLEDYGGGGVFIDYQVNLFINEGAIIQNCFADSLTASGNGGAVYAPKYSLLFFESVVIRNNKVTGNGGGISLGNEAHLTMNGGIISENTASNDGGGAFLKGNDTTISMSSCTIINNTAGSAGGGIKLEDLSICRMNGGKISGNTAVNGGGIYVANADEKVDIALTMGTIVSNNTAPNGDGGGIYFERYDEWIKTQNDTAFSCNRAGRAHQPPANAAVLYPYVQFMRTTISIHPMNNFDINYTEGGLLYVYYNLFFNANGGTGEDYVIYDRQPGDSITIPTLTEAGISREDYNFIGWNTEVDGSGKRFEPGDTMLVNCAMDLYAQWATAEITITYQANGGSGSHTDRLNETEYKILSPTEASINRSGFIFIRWNTKTDGSGTYYLPGDIVSPADDLFLYAQWFQIPSPFQRKRCRTSTSCRTSVEGRKIWIDDDNIGGTRPPSVEIILLRDGEPYKTATVDSAGDGCFAFCCLPKRTNSGREYIYQIDETMPDGYTKLILNNNVINTLIS